MSWRIGWLVCGVLLGLCSAAASEAQTARATTTLTISGAVAKSMALGVDDLKRFPTHSLDYLPGNEASPEKGSTAPRHYTGCLLRDVLAAARPVEAKPRDLRRSYVVASASDGYQVVFSWGELFISPTGDNVIVAYERDGQPLSADEGAIALVAGGDRRPVRHVKWLQSVELRTIEP